MKKNKNLRYVLRRLLLIFIVLLLGFLALGIGLMVCYGILGNGKDTLAIFYPAKWQV